MEVSVIPARSLKLNIMLMLKNQAVTKPMATVPIMAMGIIFSGLGTSSAKCVAQSRQAKAQLQLIRPTIKAIPFWGHPVELIKVAKTKLADSWVGALAGTVMRITANETRETYRVQEAKTGRIRP